MSDTSTVETPLFVEPGQSEGGRPDETLDTDAYYGHLSKKQVGQIRRAVRNGGEDEIDIQAEKYGLDRTYIERVVATDDNPKRKYKTRIKREEPVDTLDIPDISDEELLNTAGVEQVYSTNDVADFFDRSNQWIYWGLRATDPNGVPITPVFSYDDGSPIAPSRIGDPDLGRRRFTLPIIKDILLSSYRRGNVTPDELKKVLRRIRIAQLGGNWKDREGWTGREITPRTKTD